MFAGATPVSAIAGKPFREGEEAMNITEVRHRAQAIGVSRPSRMKKGDLIRRIQLQEGNFDCFGSPGRFDCPRLDCCWRNDCLTPDPG